MFATRLLTLALLSTVAGIVGAMSPDWLASTAVPCIAFAAFAVVDLTSPNPCKDERIG